MLDQTQKTTERALALIAEGREEGIDLLYTALGPSMLLAARAVTHDRFLAEDVVQDSFLKVVRHISSYRRGTNARAWVLKIVRNTALNAVKSRRPVSPLQEAVLACAPDVEEAAGDRITVKKLLEDLPADSAQMVYMKYFLDMTVREIAAELGVSKSLVSKKILSAEKIMASKLKN